MIKNWLSPINTKLFPFDDYEDYQLGRNIAIHKTASPSLEGVELVFIGMEEQSANAVRAALYQMAFPFDELKVVDLGNMRKSNENFIIPLVQELLQGKIVPVLIGDVPDLLLTPYKACRSLKQRINLVMIEDAIPFTENATAKDRYYLNDIVHREESMLFQFGVVGGQLQYTRPNSLQFLRRKNYEYIRLGEAKADMSELEPVIRFADVLGVNLSVMQQSDMPAQIHPTPTGFDVFEMCKIARYAGMSDKLLSFAVSGLDIKHTELKRAGAVVAQMIWYFMDGYYHRKGDFPLTNQGMTEYVVDFRNDKITFWKSNRSGRWWLQVPVKTGEGVERHRLIACSYNDYQKALEGELGGRLVRAFKRF